MSARRERAARWWSGVLVLVQLDLRQRLRTTRWKVGAAAAFAVISLVVLGSLYVMVGAGSLAYADWAENLYVIVGAIVVFVGLVLAPTLTATSINGDRKDAVLAVVQATPVSAGQIAVGKLLGGWASCLALVAVASPYLVWGIVSAPYGVGPGLLGVVVLCLVFLCWCGVGLGFSALTARPAGSAVLTQAAVFTVLLGLPAIFGLLLQPVSQDHGVVRAEYVYDPAASADAAPTCRDVEVTRSFAHTERIWWLLAPHPFLLIPDVVAAHDNPDFWSYRDTRPPTLASSAADALSDARTGPWIDDSTCADQTGGAWYSTDPDRLPTPYAEQRAHDTAAVGDSWYVGLAMNAVFGALGLTAAARRLRVPAGRLPRGVRIA